MKQSENELLAVAKQAIGYLKEFNINKPHFIKHAEEVIKNHETINTKQTDIIPVKENEIVLISVENNEKLIIPTSIKNHLVDEELVFNNGNNWLYFENSTDEIIKIKNAVK